MVFSFIEFMERVPILCFLCNHRSDQAHTRSAEDEQPKNSPG